MKLKTLVKIAIGLCISFWVMWPDILGLVLVVAACTFWWILAQAMTKD